MRKKVAGVIVAAVAMAATAVAVVALNAGGAQAATSEPYTWKNVRIDGGGFIPGIVFNQTEQNLIYARTDIGGAYRWDQATSKWVPLLDSFGWANWGYNGVVSIATDPVQTSKVYAAVGMYTNAWDPNNGAILRSSDKGATWQVTVLPFKLGGNMPGRGMGERLAVDPNRNSILYFGAPSGNGLWKSTDSGVTWAKVTNFPNVGNYIQQPGDVYLGDNQGVVWVNFDKSTGTAGNVTQGIYVGVADKQNTVYRSTNGGSTWERIAGQPTGFMAHKGVIDPANHLLYIATSDTGGPYDGAKGDVWKYNITSGAWTQISPIPSSSADDYFGYGGLTIDRLHPNTIMVATQISWWPDAIFFRSTDQGATWTRIWDFTSYPNRSFRYTQNISTDPWLTFGTNPQPPEITPKLGWMNDSVEIDPFNSNRLMYGTGATLYGTTNLTNWDAGTQITITPMATGIEETAALDLISPPTGAPLISGLGDVAGFRHTNLDAVPPAMFSQPNFSSTTSLDYAETSPATMVRAGNFTDSDRPNDSHVAFSTDGGANWFQGTEPGGINSGGTVAAAANGSRFVWSPGDSGQPVVFSVGFGNSWTQASGVPANSVIESDRVNANKFYAFNAGRFYVSTNGGQTFTQTAATGLPTAGDVRYKALPGIEGDVWLAGGDAATSVSGLWHSTNSGASFTKVSNVTDGVSVGFGLHAPGQTYPALFIMGTVDGVKGVYRSDNQAGTWVRINDNAHQFGNAGAAITGDPRIYGRVYLGTNGRGVLYADRQGGTTTPPPDTTAPTTPGTPTASNVTSTGATLTWTASTDSGGSGLAGYDVINASNTVIATSTTNSVALTGLASGTQFVLRIRARDGAGNLSTPSGSVTFTTTASTDTQAPTTPGTPTASNITSTGATLSWTASTDNVNVTGYDVLNASNTVIATSTTNSVALTGLASNTQFVLRIRARDAAGNLSTPSGSVTFSTTGGGGTGGCSATYSIANQWGTGFSGAVVVTNTGTTATSSWKVTWTFANGQVISDLWNGIFTQSGANVTVNNQTYNNVINPGGNTSFGFNASWSGTNAVPTTVTCTRTP
jgi:chitodextrinase